MQPAQFFRIAKALADEQRFRLLESIAAAAPGELCCSELVQAAGGVSQATVSHHLKELVAADLVERRKDKQFAYFRIRGENMQAYAEELGRRMRSATMVGGH